MLAIDIVLSLFGLGYFCWLLFTLAVYALPFFAGLTVAFAAFQGGAGIIGAFLIGCFAGGVTLTAGQIAFATVRSPLTRAGIALLYAVPAAIAGYHATLGLAQIGVPSARWQVVFAIIGAIAIGCTAWARMAMFASPSIGHGFAVGPAPLSLADGSRSR
ncbi:MAG: hypothetical protein POH28_04190 [Acidocella sp.]|nr:hypothetical protein [Acidocella sp.]